MRVLSCGRDHDASTGILLACCEPPVVACPQLSHAVVTLRSHRPAPVNSILPKEWIEDTFTKTVQSRGAKVMEARKLSSALSAAHAVAGHLRDWVSGTPEGRMVSMGVYSNGKNP